MKKVVILMGISGAGKSTYIKNKLFDYYICSADNYFLNADGEYKFDVSKLGEAHGECLRLFISHITNGVRKVVVDNTNTSVSEIAPYASIALAYGYDLKIVVLSTEIAIAAARNVHNVPRKTVEGQQYRLSKTLKEMPPWWPVEYI